LAGPSAAPNPVCSASSISEEDAELKRLRLLPKNAHTTARFFGREFKVTDAQSFAAIYDSYFTQEHYRFLPSTEAPLILDCGANVGIGVHYWKQLCPRARVIAFEPDAEAFAALSSNCAGLPDVICRPEAVWTTNGRIKFTAIGGDGGHLSEVAKQADAASDVSVQAVRLRDLFSEPVELLKLDIEGAEVDVVLDCADRLGLVRLLFVEFHSFVNKPQRLGAFLQAIEQAGFRLHGQPEMPAPQPFIDRPVYNEKDFRLNLYCFRD
jgi:FkbM family methyltransferase